MHQRQPLNLRPDALQQHQEQQEPLIGGVAQNVGGMPGQQPFGLQHVLQHAEQHPGADGMPGRYFNPQQVQHHQLFQQQLYMQQQQQRGGNGGVNRLGIPNGGPQDFPWNLMGPPPGIPQPHQNMLHAPPGLRPPTGIISQFHRRQGM